MTTTHTETAVYRLAFFVYSHNLAEVTRGVEIAKALRRRGHDICFFTHSGWYDSLIESAGFECKHIDPVVTPEKHQYILDVDQGRRPHPLFADEELRDYVEHELDALRTFRPDAIYLGVNLPTSITAKVMKCPLITAYPAAALPMFYRRGLGQFPDSHNRGLLQLLPRALKDYAFNQLMPRNTLGIKPFIRVGRAYGITSIRNYWDVIAGDLTLVTDIPEISGLAEDHLPESISYIGPLFAHLDGEIPPEVYALMERPGKTVFIAMGSSAPKDLLLRVVHALNETNYNLIIATTSIMEPEDLGPLPGSAYATKYLPAHKISQLVDVTVCHGGQGTLQTACWAGVPVVGIALQFEQQANLASLERTGMACRLPLADLTPHELCTTVEKVLTTDSYRHSAKRIQELVRGIDGSLNAAIRIERMLNTAM